MSGVTVYEVDPLQCRKCGGPLKIVAYINDQISIKRILDHLGLSPPEQEKPPPAVHEVVRVPVDEEHREMEEPSSLPSAMPAKALDRGVPVRAAEGNAYRTSATPRPPGPRHCGQLASASAAATVTGHNAARPRAQHGTRHLSYTMCFSLGRALRRRSTNLQR